MWCFILGLYVTNSLVLAAELNVYGDKASDEFKQDRGILHIKTDCATKPSGSSRITVTSSQDVVVRVVCKNQVVAEPKPHDKVHYVQEVTYDGNKDNPCTFEKKDKSDIYTVTMSVGQVDKESGLTLIQAGHDFLITCSYDERGSSISQENEITFTKSKLHLQEIGGILQSQISLSLMKLDGSPANSPVQLGAVIRLVAKVISGKDSIQPSTCTASNGIHNHTVLQSGCGDGIVFPKDKGFTVAGRDITSPNFSAFRLQGNPSLVFTCRFITCTDCDGYTCRKGQKRHKRDVTSAMEEEMYEVSTGGVTVASSKKEPKVIYVDATKAQSVVHDLDD